MLVVSGAVPAGPIAELFDTSMTVSAESTTGIPLTENGRRFLINGSNTYAFDVSSNITVYLGATLGSTEPPEIDPNESNRPDNEFREGNTNYYSCKPTCVTINENGVLTIDGNEHSYSLIPTSDRLKYWQLVYKYVESAGEYRAWFTPVAENNLVMTYAAPVTYDGNRHNLVTISGAAGKTHTRYRLYPDGEWQYAAVQTYPRASAAGTYEVQWYSEDSDGYLACGSEDNWQTVSGTMIEIQRAAPEYSIAPTAKTGLTYNGGEQTLVNAGRTSDGTILYSTTSATSGFSSELPKATNAGTYTVWYKIQGDGNHNDSEAVEISGITIVPKTVGLNWDDEPLYYTGSPQVPGCTATGLVGDDECTVTVEGAQTSVGTGYTATATALSNPNYALPNDVTATFSIDKTSPIVTAPTALQLVYNKTEQDLITAGMAVTGCTITYSTSQDGPFTSDIPKGTDADDYTVWYKVNGDETHADIGPVQVTGVYIAQREVGIQWSTDTEFDYDGEEHAPIATATGLLEGDECFVTVTGAASTAGNHTATASALSNDNYKLPEDESVNQAFTINKVNSVLNTAPTAYDDSVYKGKTVLFSTSGSAAGGYVRYGCSTVEGQEPTQWANSTNGDAACGTDADTYYLWYKVEGDRNHNDLAPVYIGSVTISQRELELSWGSNKHVYDGQPYAPGVSATNLVSGDTVNFTVTGAGTNLGEYTAKVTAIDNNNYKLPADTTYAFSIINAYAVVTAAPEIDASGFTYDGELHQVITYAGAAEGGTIQYAVSKSKTVAPTQWADSISDEQVKLKDAGTYYVWYRVKADEAHSDLDAMVINEPIVVEKKTVGIEWSDTELTYTGDYIKPTATAIDLAEGDTCEVTVSGQQRIVGDYTATANAVSNTNYKLPDEGLTTEFSIIKADPTASVTAKNITYSGNAQTLFDVSVNGGTLLFSTNYADADDYSETIPAGTDAGEYEVWYKVVGDSNHNDLGPVHVTGTVAQRTVGISWGTASFTYDGDSHLPTATATNVLSGETCELTVTGAQTEAGEYVATVTAVSDNNYKLPEAVTKDFTIRKANATATAPELAAGLVYNGDQQQLITGDGSVVGGGTVFYAIGTSGTSAPGSDWSTDITSELLSRTDAGTYYIWYKADESDNYNAKTATLAGTVTIQKAGSSVVTPPEAITELSYIGEDQALITEGEASTGAEMRYAVSDSGDTAPSDSAFTADVPTRTAVGNYYVWYKAFGDANHNNSEAYVISVEIAKADNGYAAEPTARTLTFNKGEQALLNEGEAQHGTIKYMLGAVDDDTAPDTTADSWSTVVPDGINAGDYRVWCYIDGGDSYQSTEPMRLDVNIAELDISNARVVISPTSVDSADVVPAVRVVMVGTVRLSAGTDYTVEYSVSEGIGTVTITPINPNYTGTATAEYVVGVDMRKAELEEIDSAEYTGSQITPNVTVTYNGETLEEGTDYTVEYGENTEVGQGTVTVTGTGDYRGTLTGTFTITKKDIAGCDFAELLPGDTLANKTYTGSPIVPTLTIKNGELILAEQTADEENDYFLHCEDNTDPGQVTLVVLGQGSHYTGYKQITFNIKGALDSTFVSGAVTRVIPLNSSGEVDANSFTADDFNVTFNGRVLTLGTDFEITGVTKAANRTGSVTIKALDGSDYTGQMTIGYRWSNAEQTLTVPADLAEYVTVTDSQGTELVSAGGGYTLSVGERYTVNNKTIDNDTRPYYVLTLSSTEGAVEIGKDGSTTFEVIDGVDYEIAVHSHNLTLVEYEGRLYSVCTGEDTDRELVATLTDVQESYIYGETIAPNVEVEDGYTNDVTAYEFEYYDLATGARVSAENINDIINKQAGTGYRVVAKVTYKGAVYTMSKETRIVPKEITVTPDASEKIYGEADPAFTCTVEADGLVSEDRVNESELAAGFASHISREDLDNNNVGQYSYVLLDGTEVVTSLTIGNYTISLADGNRFKIKAKTIDVALANTEFTYGYITNSTDLVETLGASVSHSDMEYDDETDNVPIVIDITDSTYTTAGYLNANETGYSITATTTNANYKLNVPQTLVINKKDIEGAVKLNETEFGYTHEDKTVNVVTNDGDKLTVSSDVTVVDTDSTVTAMNANEYSVKVTATNDGNYTGTTTLTWKITPHALVDADISFDDSVVYNAAEQRPVINVAGVGNGEDTLVKDTDYIVISDGSGKNVGEYTVQIRGNGNYTGTASKTFNITKAQQEVNVTPKTMVYDGAAVNLADDFVVSSEGLTEEPETVVTLKFYTKNGDDYTPVDEAKNAGTYYVKATVAATGNYEAKTSDYVPFEINRRSITVTPDPDQSKIYGVADSGFTCTTDDEVANSEHQSFNEYIGRNAGENVDTYAYTITAEDGIVGNYVISIDPANTNAFEIKKKDITDLFIQDQREFTYDGTAHTLTVTGNYSFATADIVKDLGTNDYDIAGNVQTDVNRTGTAEVGTYTATVTGKGNYTGSIEFQYTIEPKALTDADVTLSSDSFTFNGAVQKPTVTVTGYDESELVAGDKTYAVEYSDENSTAQGEYTVTVTGQGNYSGEIVKTYNIGKKSLADADVAITAASVTFNGGEQKAALTFRINDETVELLEGTDYTVTGNKQTNAGTYTITVTGIGNYSGENSAVWTVEKKAVTVTPKDGQTFTYGTTLGTGDTFASDYTITGAQDDAFVGKDLLDAETAYSTAQGVVGTYGFAVDSGYDADDYPNYTITFDLEGKTFEVTKKDISDTDGITIELADGGSYEYTGGPIQFTDKLTATYATVWGDKAITYTVGGHKSGTNVGSYSSTVRANGNFTGDKDMPWSITNAQFANRAYDVEDKTYDGTAITGYELTTIGTDPDDAQITYKFFEKNGDTYTSIGTAAPKDAGDYKVEATITAESYEDRTFTAEFTIAQRSVNVNFGDIEITYGVAVPATVSKTVEGVNGETLTATAAVTAGSDLDAGTHDYSISKVTLSDNNYTLGTTTTGSLIVNSKPLTEDMFIVDKTYTDGTSWVTPVITTDLTDADYSPDTDLSTDTAKAFGTYDIVLNGQGNYTGQVTKEWVVAEDFTGRAHFISGNTVSYRDYVIFNFLAEIDESLTEGAYVIFTYDHYGEEQQVRVDIDTSEAGKNGGYYRFGCPLTASEMAIDVKADLYITAQEEAVSTKTRTIENYAKLASELSSEPTERVLARALLNYGGYTQLNQGLNTDKLAYDGVQDDVSNVNIQSTIDFERPTEAVDGICYYGTSGMFVSAPFNRHYFAVEDGHDISEYTFEINGVEKAPTLNTARYYIDSDPIKSYQMDDEQKVVVKRNGQTIMSYSYSMVTYLSIAAEKGDDNAKNQAKAMYSYYQAAVDFVNRT